MKLRHNRSAWVAHCRAVQFAKDMRNKDDDGMSDGIILFGAVSQWASIEEQRLKAALAAPVLARVTEWDVSGVTLLITCPYCQQEQEHEHHVVPDDWAQEMLLMASCNKGAYFVKLSWSSLTRP